MQLRDYQEDAVNAIYEYWETGKGKNSLIVAPTASGKSIMIAEFCKRTCTENKNVRIVCVTHTRELISQNEKELKHHWREANTGIYSAGLGKRQTKAQILFVGIQSIYKRAFELGKIDVILVDECFPYNTRVTTDAGVQMIGDIVERKLPVRVLTHTGGFKKVISHIKKPMPDIMVCVIHEKGRVDCTPNHRFLTTLRGWVKAEGLTSGDYIYRYNGTLHTRAPEQSIACAMGETNTRTEARTSDGTLEEKERMASRLCSYSKTETNCIGESYGRHGYKLSEQQEQLSPFNYSSLFETVRVCGLEIYGVKKPVPFPATTDKERGVWGYELHCDKPVPPMSVGNIQPCKDRWQDKVHGTLVELNNRANRFYRVVYGRWFDRTSRSEHKHLYGKGVCGGRRFGCVVAGEPMGVESNSVPRTQGITNRDIQTTRCIHGAGYSDEVGAFLTNHDVQNTVYDLEVEDDHTYTANGIVVHNCHLIPRAAETRYGQFISDMHIANPNVAVVGFTATPYRLDSGTLHEGEGALFDGIAYVCEMKKLIGDGYLVPVISKGGVEKIDLSHVHTRAGDYAANELAHAADDPQLIKHAVAEIVAYGKDRKAWLIFASGVTHAEHVAEEVRKHGITCEVVTGETPKGERDATVEKFKTGGIRCLVNVAVFTTGFNVPRCDMIALLMATQSTGKYVQIVGRGMRTYPGKENCLLMDYGGNVLAHGMVDDIEPIQTANIFNVVENPDPVKECPQCRALLHTRVMICPACDYEFPVTATHGTEAYDGAVLSDQQAEFVVEVVEMYCTRHHKIGGTDSVKMAFYDKADKEYALWLCLNHTGFAKDKAVSIVRQFGGRADSVDSALKEWSYWKVPTHIRARPEGKYFRITGFKFDENKVVTKQTCLVTE